MSRQKGVLYIVATPIGNLGDLTHRALEVLAHVDQIAAEDTRHTSGLLSHFGLSKHTFSVHEHNEAHIVPDVIKRLSAGLSIALVSDAGTPLLSDPGYRLVKAAREAGIVVTPVPGPNAAIAALCVSGLATDRFVFEGFLPVKMQARQNHLATLKDETRTLIFYESKHRILACLQAMSSAFGGRRYGVIARELTKAFEQVVSGDLEFLCHWLESHPDHQRGEFVVLISGTEHKSSSELDAQTQKWLHALLAELPLKTAVRLAAQVTGISRKILYTYALEAKSLDHEVVIPPK